MADPATSDLILESLDAIPEPLRALFQQEGGVGFKYIKPPSADEYANAKRQQNRLMDERKAEKAKREEYERQLTELRAKFKVDDQDVDPDEALEAWRKLRQDAVGNGKPPTDAVSRAEAEQAKAKALADAKTKSEKELADIRTERDRLTEQLHTTVCEGGLRAFCDDPQNKLPFKLQEGAVDALLDTARASRVLVVDKDGKPGIRAEVYDDEGNQIEGLGAWVAYQVSKRPFLAIPSSGSGAHTAAGNGAGIRGRRLEDMSEMDKAKLSREDPEAFRKAVMAKAERDRQAIRQRNAGVAA